MRASLLTRAGAATAAGAIAFTGAMVTAGAADAATAHRLPTHLGIAKRHATEHHRRITLIGGDLRSHRVPLRGRTVYLDGRLPGHKWVVVGHENTGRRGQVVFAVDPKITARYKLVYKGTKTFRPSQSRVVTVKGRAK
jgi:hypothetical protein